jgi:hypothetical protein
MNSKILPITADQQSKARNIFPLLNYENLCSSPTLDMDIC